MSSSFSLENEILIIQVPEPFSFLDGLKKLVLMIFV